MSSIDWLLRCDAQPSRFPPILLEGFGRWHSKEFVHFLLVANGSLKELETHLLIGKRLGFFRAPELAKPVSLVEEIGRMLAAPRKRPER